MSTQSNDNTSSTPESRELFDNRFHFLTTTIDNKFTEEKLSLLSFSLLHIFVDISVLRLVSMRDEVVGGGECRVLQDTELKKYRHTTIINRSRKYFQIHGKNPGYCESSASSSRDEKKRLSTFRLIIKASFIAYEAQTFIPPFYFVL